MARERRSKSPPYGADHPSNVELAMVAAGTLDTAKADLIATHVCGCASCRTFVRAMEHVGGAILDGLPPTPLADTSCWGDSAARQRKKWSHPEKSPIGYASHG